MKNKRRIFALCIDGATFGLIKPWVEEGKLPAFKKLMDGGVHGYLKSTIPPITCPAVPTFYTGKKMGETGILSFTKEDGSLFSFKDIKERTFWEVMGEHGIKSCIFNLPNTYPPRKLNGILIGGGGIIPSSEVSYTYPESIKEEFDFPVDVNWVKLYKNSSRRDFMLELKKITEKRFEILDKLIEREDYGIVLFWIENSDIMQHMIWKSPELLLEYYSMIDKKIEGIKNKHRFDNLFVFSDHGFEGCPKYNFFIHTWLEREGYLRFKGGSIGRSVISRIYPQVKKRVPNKVVAILKKRFKKKKAEKGESIYQLIPGVEWERTVAYAMGWGINIIRNNIKDGDYNSVRDEIIDKLKKLRWNGLPVMREVKTRESEYTGPYTNKLPDILFVSGEDFATTNYPNSEIVGEDITVVNKDYEGEHGAARNGILIASGSDIARCKEIEGAELIDLVPTLLHMVGVPIPEDLDGKVLKEIFREDSEIAKREVVYQKIDERERIRGRVRKLKLK